MGGGERARAAHPGRPHGFCQWRGADGGRAAGGLGVSDQTLKVWEVESGRELRTLTGHTNGVNGGGSEWGRAAGGLGV